jgi:hypothetical protein
MYTPTSKYWTGEPPEGLELEADEPYEYWISNKAKAKPMSKIELELWVTQYSWFTRIFIVDFLMEPYKGE